MRQDFTNVTEEMRSDLFPIILKAHDPAWLEAYTAERGVLQTVFGEKIKRISHIGSSAVPGLIAKPTVDILLEIERDLILAPYTEKMLDAGYVVNTPQQDIIMYLKGYTPRGFEGQCGIPAIGMNYTFVII